MRRRHDERRSEKILDPETSRDALLEYEDEERIEAALKKREETDNEAD